MMTHTYNISGMTCGGCVAKAKSQLLMLGDITEAKVQLASPQATISMNKHIPLPVLQNTLNKAGNYTITDADGSAHLLEETPASMLTTYKPIFIIGAYITGITLLIQAMKGSFDGEVWMRHFMAAFFLVFSFFKMLDLKAFAESYSSYDIIAGKWQGWGYVYALIELALGVAYLVNFEPVITNGVTVVIMSLSIIGVLRAVLHKRTIQCACLGAVFNLPMSAITIIEDALMIAMSMIMLVNILA